MYNFRAKCVHVRDLARERFAEVDLEILRKVAPEHSESLDIRPAGPRHEVVLHALLDIVTREAIEKMRDEILNSDTNEAEPPKDQPDGKADGGTEEQPTQTQNGDGTTETSTDADEENPETTEAESPKDQPDGNADGETEEKQAPDQDGDGTTEADTDTDEENSGLKDQVNDLSGQPDDLNGRMDDLEGQVSEIAEDLNEQKKSGKRPQKSKKKTNTR
ncbi:TPA_asm: hypothetical protein [Porphyromonas phage phage018a_AFR5B1]|uniref:Uncharacterized protein n=3 Tax=root TaxID=1 RepID=A0AAT9J8H5_9CAUD